MTHLRHVTILGAGLTGLTTAYRLATALPSTRIALVEASERVGGWVGSSRHQVQFRDEDGMHVAGEVTLDSGPRSIRPRGSRGAASMLKLVRDLGLEDSILPVSLSHPAAKNRFLLDPSTSQLVKLPSGPTALLGRQPPLLAGLIWAILSEPFRKRSAQGDESVDAFVRRRLGANVANLVSAMVHGIYAADSRQLSVRSAFPVLWDAEAKHGSIVAGMLLGTKSRDEKAAEAREWAELGELGKKREGWSVYGLRGGLGVLTKRLEEEVMAAGVDLRRGEAVTALKLGEDMEVSTTRSSFGTSHLVSALSPSTLSHFIPLPLHNPSTTVGVINLVYPLPPHVVHPAGFGYLVPRSTVNPEGVLGVIFDSTAIPGNDDPALEGKVTKLTVMMGGPWWSSYPGISAPRTRDELIPPAMNHLYRIFPSLRQVDPLLVQSSLQKDCIPTYLPGHGQRLSELHRLLATSHESISGWAGRLSLVGSGYGGVGVNDCVLSAERVVAGLARGERPTGLEAWGEHREA